MTGRLDETLTELLMGILAFGLISQIIGMWFVVDMGAYTIGLWIGILLAALSAVHMWWSLDRNLTINADNEKGAVAYATKWNMVRYGVILLVFLILCLTDFAYPLSAFLGIMGLKIGAYLQPFMEKIYKKYIDRR